ncbi:metalloendopeptidase [Trichonephila clavipes]|nr:metalloendopeptidase [Trichonephila clavipes]
MLWKLLVAFLTFFSRPFEGPVPSHDSAASGPQTWEDTVEAMEALHSEEGDMRFAPDFHKVRPLRKNTSGIPEKSLSIREPESSCVSTQKSRISRLEISTTEFKGLAQTFSKVPCMTGWSFNLSVELQFRNCGNLRKCEIPSWTHTLHSNSPIQKVSSFVTLYDNMRRDPLKMYPMS